MSKLAITRLLVLASLAMRPNGGHTQELGDTFTPDIPITWDDAAMASLEVPLAQPEASPKHISAADYYKLPVRPIYKSYPEYHPDYEPAGYRERLQGAKPQILWDDRGTRPPLKSEADWIKAGELVFHAPIAFIPLAPDAEAERSYYRQTGDLITKEGVNPFEQLVVREHGQLVTGIGSCADCHTRVMPDGSLILGAQGNRPLDRVIAFTLMRQPAASATNREEFLKLTQQFELVWFAAPWLRPDPNARLGAMALDELAAAREAVPPGVFAREGSSVFCPPQVPDLIGLKNRRYLDNTGLVRHRSIGDLMRYAALNQGAQLLARYGDFVPVSATVPAAVRDMFPETTARYSDEQLYALALYLYSLKPPMNPNLPATAERKTLVNRGVAVFEEQDCARCHTPPHYTNNRLVAAPGFDVPADHPEKMHILEETVDTNPTLTLKTRRGTGFYKMPSLRGVWYRGPFEHNGSCATLEDWFDPARLKDDYVPTGWKGPPGTKTRAVKGHEFGLDLSEEDREALIAFLKTL